jgi:hypothetical protein
MNKIATTLIRAARRVPEEWPNEGWTILQDVQSITTTEINSERWRDRMGEDKKTLTKVETDTGLTLYEVRHVGGAASMADDNMSWNYRRLYKSLAAATSKYNSTQLESPA